MTCKAMIPTGRVTREIQKLSSLGIGHLAVQARLNHRPLEE